jgi:hypothetical protein
MLFYKINGMLFSLYSVFHQFEHAESADGGLILSLCQFLLLPLLQQKMELATRVVKINSKIIISLP